MFHGLFQNNIENTFGKRQKLTLQIIIAIGKAQKKTYILKKFCLQTKFLQKQQLST